MIRANISNLGNAGAEAQPTSCPVNKRAGWGRGARAGRQPRIGGGRRSRNKWWLILQVALGVTVLAGAEANTSARPTTAGSEPGPDMIFAEEIFDFGRIISGAVVRHTFGFTNAGTRTLEITRIVPGCGCTTVTAPEPQIAPGQTGIIPVEFNSRGLNGIVSRPIHVYANDPRRSNVVLRIMADVWTPVELRPNIVAFYHEPEFPTSETKMLRVLNHREEPVTISVAEWTNQSFHVALETIRPGHEFAVKITSVPPLGVEAMTLPLILKTSALEVPSLKAYVCALARPAIAAKPNQLTVPAGPLPMPEQRALMIRNLGREPLQLSEPAVDLPGVKARVNEIRSGRLFSIVVTFPAGFELPVRPRTELRVRSSHPRYPVFRFPVVEAARAVASPGPTGSETDLDASVVSASP